jgi:ABC-2 type transport system ATP-binding protein
MQRLIKIVLLKTNDNESAIKHLAGANYHAAVNSNNEIEITDEKAISNPEYIAALIVERGLSLQQLYVHTEDLEKFFLRTIKA